MTRVLIAGYCSVPSPDRTGVQLGHVLRAIGRDEPVDVLCVRGGDQAYVERKGALRFLRVPIPDDTEQAQIESFRRALRRQLEGADYRVVLVRDSISGIPVLQMREQLGYAVIFDVGRSPISDLVATPGTDDTAVAEHDLCVGEADLVLAATEASRRYLATRSTPDRVHLVPLGTDIDLFDWDDPPPDGGVRIVHIGDLKGGGELLLDAFARVRENIESRLILAGEVDEHLQAAIESRDLGENVECRGAIDHLEVPALISTATICVAPVAQELAHPTSVFPTKILEYLACHRAVVAPRTGTVTMLLRDRQHGYLFEPGDAESFAMGMSRLLGDRELRARLARAGYEMVRREHTASRTRRCFRRAFNWLRAQPVWRERWESTGTVDQPPLVQSDSIDAPFTDQILLDAEPVDHDDLTVVEPGPARSADETGTQDTREAPLLSSSRDDWVVDETARATGEVDAMTVVEDEPLYYDRSESPRGRALFVAGELEVSTNPGRSKPTAGDEPAFTAVAAPLGGTTRRDRGDPEPAAPDSVSDDSKKPQ